MNPANYLRLALLLSEGRAHTFKRNLLTIVQLILAEHYGTSPVTISDIIKEINSNYSLSFSDQEVKNAIFSARSGEIIELKPVNDPVYYTYQLSPKAYEKFKRKKDTTDPLPSLIEKFCTENPDLLMISQDDLKEAVYRFLYQSFNSDIKTVLALMNYHGETKQFDLEKKGFTNEQILTLNAFLNWHDDEKNKLIFQYVSFCYEYCVITMKKDTPTAASIFGGKEFYLDTNIIFRLAGFNKAERRDSVTAFLNKCKECGVGLNFTNFTKSEIDATLNYYVKHLREFFKDEKPVSVDAVKALSPGSANTNFYEQYVAWTKDPQNRVGDYSSFLSDLKRQVLYCTRDIKSILHETFDQYPTKEIFQQYCQDLSFFKSLRHRPISDSSIQVDVENYMVIRDLAKHSSQNSFYEQKYSFITADHAYIDWTREKMPGTMPLFVLPSVWYSIMLKYHGRTNNDYTAFCQFLKMRVTDTVDDQQETREAALAYIMQMNETSDIKEEIMFDISSRISEMPNSIDDINEFVEDVHESITQAKVNTAVQQEQERYNMERNAFKQESEQKQSEARNIGYNEGREHGEKEGRAQGYTEGREHGEKEGHTQGYTEGREAARKELFHTQAKNRAKLNRRLRVGSIVICILCAIVFLGVLVFQYIVDESVQTWLKEFVTAHELILKIISGTFGVLSVLFAKLSKHVTWLSTDEKQLEEKYAKKAEILGNK